MASLGSEKRNLSSENDLFARAKKQRKNNKRFSVWYQSSLSVCVEKRKKKREKNNENFASASRSFQMFVQRLVIYYNEHLQL